MFRKGPTLLQAILLAVCGALMTFFGCLGYLSIATQLRPSQTAANVMIVVFFAGLVALVAGVGFLGFMIVRAIWRWFVEHPPIESSKGE